MGKVYGFWSPQHGVSGTTTTTALAGIFMTAKHDCSVMLTTDQNAHYSRFSEYFDVEYEDQMSRVHNFAKENSLKPELLDILCRKIYGVNLFILDGTDKDRIQNELNQSIGVTLKVAKNHYDYVFVDMNAGDFKSNVTDEIIKSLDGLVVLLPQDDTIIDLYKNEMQDKVFEQFKDKHIILSIGRYQNYDHYNIRRIKRSLKLKELLKFSLSEAVHKAVYQGKLVERICSEVKGVEKEFSPVLSELDVLANLIEKS